MLVQKLPSRKRSENKSRVVIIRTGAVGLSSTTRHIPQIMDFEMLHVRKHDPLCERGGPNDCVQYFRQACDGGLKGTTRNVLILDEMEQTSFGSLRHNVGPRDPSSVSKEVMRVRSISCLLASFGNPKSREIMAHQSISTYHS